MKILVLSSLYPNNQFPNHGVFVKERMTHFVKITDSTVQVVAPVPFFPRLKIGYRWHYSLVQHQEIIEGVRVWHPRYYMTPKVGMSLYGLMMFFSILPTVKRVARGFSFDIIDTHYVYPDGFAGILLGRFFKRPVVVSARGSDINQYRKFPVIRKLLQYTLQHADAVIAVSHDLKNAIVKLGVPAPGVFVVQNGVDITKFYPISIDQARKQSGLKAKKIIVSIGNLVPVKGFDLLINAFKNAKEKMLTESVHLVIIGDGKSRKDLEKLVITLDLSDCVTMTGSIPHDLLNTWYNAADLFCLLSSREGYPNVLVEALTCGVPVVATGVGGIPEIINSPDLGMLVAREPDDVADKIVLALQKDWDRTKISNSVRNRTWESVATSLLNIFQSILTRDNGYEDPLPPPNPIRRCPGYSHRRDDSGVS